MSPAANIGMNNNPPNRALNQSPMGHTAGRGNMQRPPTSQPDSMLEQQQMYRLQLEKQKRQFASHPHQQNRSAVGGINAVGIANEQQPGTTPVIHSSTQRQETKQAPNQMSEGQQSVVQQKQRQAEDFMSSLINYLTTRGLSLESDPRVCGRPIGYHSLFMTVSANGILIPNHQNHDNWGLVAAHLGYSSAQNPQAADECKAIHQRNLLDFTKEWMNSVQKRKMQKLHQQHQQQQSQSQYNQQQGMRAGQDVIRAENSFSPPIMGQPYGRSQPPQSGALPHLAQQDTDRHHITSTNQGSPPGGRSVSGHEQSPRQPAGLTRQSSSDQPFGNSTRSRPSSSRAPSRGQEVDAQVTTAPESRSDVKFSDVGTSARPESPQTGKDPDIYYCRKREVGGETDPYYGGLPIDRIARYGEILAQERPGMPRLDEMGVIDLHALTMSIESGIHGEMRYALDHLVNLSYEVRIPLELTSCLSLLEALYDCGIDQLDFLSQYCPTTHDRVDFPVFESVAKEALKESKALRAMPPFASEEYELEHAADRFIAVSTILRNFSVPDSKNNHDMLNSEPSARFIASIIRRVGSSPGILRTSRNLLDFMKDIVTFLSNVSHRLEILTQDDAEAILHFLLAFTPVESPSMTEDGKLAFRTYDPRCHQYLPSAIDSLAKLLARDEPIRPLTNRTLFKTIYAEDRAVSPNSKLLTRTFALAVAPIPDRQAAMHSGDKNAMLRMAQERNSFLSQGMLAGDILSTMIQGADDEVAHEWLASTDAWAPSLLHLLVQLGFEFNTSHQRNHQGRLVDSEAGGCSIIAQRGLSMLRRLGDKVDKTEGAKGESLGIQPDREMVLHAALASHFEPVSLRQLLGFAGREG